MPEYDWFQKIDSVQKRERTKFRAVVGVQSESPVFDTPEERDAWVADKKDFFDSILKGQELVTEEQKLQMVKEHVATLDLNLAEQGESLLEHRKLLEHFKQRYKEKSREVAEIQAKLDQLHEEYDFEEEEEPEEEPEKTKCTGKTKNEKPCRNWAIPGTDRCKSHPK